MTSFAFILYTRNEQGTRLKKIPEKTPDQEPQYEPSGDIRAALKRSLARYRKFVQTDITTNVDFGGEDDDEWD